MKPLRYITEADAPGRIEARLGDLVIGKFDGYKNVCTVGVHNVYTFAGENMLSEMSWRGKVHYLSDRLISQNFWGKS